MIHGTETHPLSESSMALASTAMTVDRKEFSLFG